MRNLEKALLEHLRGHGIGLKFHLRCWIIQSLCSNSTMFSGSRSFLFSPLWDPYRISFRVFSVLSDYSMACCCSRHFSPIWKQGVKAFSIADSVLLGKEIFPKSPSPVSPYISLEGTGSNGSLGSQAKENGAGSAWVGHLVSPNKMRAPLGRKKWGMNGCFMQELMPATCCET